MTDNFRFVRRGTYSIPPGVPRPDPAVLVAKFSDAITAAVMQSIDRATIDQCQDATLDERSLRQAIRAGVTRYLADEIEKHRRRPLGEGSQT